MNKLDIYTTKDEIIEEIRRTKYQIAEKYNFSVSELVAYLKEKEKLNKDVISSKISVKKA